MITSQPYSRFEVEKELVIHVAQSEVEIALLEDGKLVELHNQKANNQFAVGDIFLGQIIKLMPGMNAAFVNIGHKKDAFLPYSNLSPQLRSLVKFTNGAINGQLATSKLDRFQLEPDIIKTGKIDQVLIKQQPLLVQMLKEPISTKGPQLTCEITLPGRFIVLSPFNEIVAVSKKIASADERKRLKSLVESVKPPKFGVIVRTAAEGKQLKEIQEEIAHLQKRWEEIFQGLKKAKPPVKLLSELDKASSMLRDMLNESFNRITVDDKELYYNIRNFLAGIAQEKMDIVKLHKTGKPIMEVAGVTRQIKGSFGKIATMSSGAYLVIEHTEAMHVIDVNSGHKMSSGTQAEAVLAVNLEAAEEVARQLRLRDIGGIIIVDFIDMKDPEHKKVLHAKMKDFMKKDRAQHTILQLSKFGLMQITRQRVRPDLKINTAEVCPSCQGTGKVMPTVLITDDIERDLSQLMQARPNAKLSIQTHPFVAAYLTKGWGKSPQWKWLRRYWRWIAVKGNPELGLNQYKFFDEHADEIRLSVASTETATPAS